MFDALEEQAARDRQRIAELESRVAMLEALPLGG